jgi:hypothetical protein
MKAILTILALAAAVLFVGPAAQAQTVSGDVSLEFDFPPLLILYYYSDMSVDVDSTDLATMMAGGNLFDMGAKSAVTSGSTADFDILTPGVPLPIISMELTRTWAVRSVGSSTSVSVTPLNTTLNGPSGSTIQLASIAPNPSSFSPTGFGGLQSGGYTLGLDLTGATQAGLYSGAGNQLRITVQQP